jgi:hypothetical protein
MGPTQGARFFGRRFGLQSLLSPNGQRFLILRLEQKQTSLVTEMTLGQNRFEELKRLLA